MISDLFTNQVLLASLTAWLIAQTMKVPVEYRLTRRLNWSLLLQAGGMPSSHSALVFGAAASIGLNVGFGTPLFALSFVVAMIISYDASGVRRQAGLHAERINTMINELLQGHPISENQLKEVLGHTQRQVFAGGLLGVLIALIFWLFSR